VSPGHTGAAVVVPVWNSHAHDGERADLLRSVDFTRGRAKDANGIMLVGWSQLVAGEVAARIAATLGR